MRKGRGFQAARSFHDRYASRSVYVSFAKTG